MTPEREKWWKTVSISEKYLRLELDVHRNTIKECKKTLNNKLYRKILSKLNVMEEYYIIRDTKDKIIKAKIISNAIKHELNNMNTTKNKNNLPGTITLDTLDGYKAFYRCMWIHKEEKV